MGSPLDQLHQSDPNSSAAAIAAPAPPAALILGVQTFLDRGTKAPPMSVDSIIRSSRSADSAMDCYRRAITSAQQAMPQAPLVPSGASQSVFHVHAGDEEDAGVAPSAGRRVGRASAAINV
jgi:hypothetical protein